MVGILVAKVATGCRSEAADLYVVALIASQEADARIRRIEDVALAHVNAQASCLSLCLAQMFQSWRCCTCQMRIISPSFLPAAGRLAGRNGGAVRPARPAP